MLFSRGRGSQRMWNQWRLNLKKDEWNGKKSDVVFSWRHCCLFVFHIPKLYDTTLRKGSKTTRTRQLLPKGCPTSIILYIVYFLLYYYYYFLFSYRHKELYGFRAWSHFFFSPSIIHPLALFYASHNNKLRKLFRYIFHPK